jgi:hypothetical protein
MHENEGQHFTAEEYRTVIGEKCKKRTRGRAAALEA